MHSPMIRDTQVQRKSNLGEGFLSNLQMESSSQCNRRIHQVCISRMAHLSFAKEKVLNISQLL